METTNGEITDRLLYLLANPLRREIVRVVQEGEVVSPREFTRQVEGHVLSSVAYHFRVLAEAGILELVSTRPVRGSTEHFYRSQPLTGWAEELMASESA